MEIVRFRPVLRLLVPSVMAVAVTCGLHGCAPAAQPSGVTARAAAPSGVASPVAQATTEAAGPSLDLCRPPDLAPAALRSKPGYTQLRVSVADEQGAPVSGLKESDFAVQAGKESYPIAYFRAESSADTPVSLVLVGDVSRTMYAKTMVADGKDRETARATINHASEHLNECDEIAVVTVGGTSVDETSSVLAPVTLAQPFTSDQTTALSKLYAVEPSGEQLLPDGIRMALGTIADAHYANRALVVMTDGLDQKAVEDSVSVLESAPRGSFSFWVIGIGDPDATDGVLSKLTGTKRINIEGIKRLAIAGGGKAIFVKPVESDKGASLADAVSTIASDLARGYTMGLVAPPTAAKLSVTIANQPGAIVRQEVVSPQLLAAAADLPEPVVCMAGSAAIPQAISSQPGFTLLTATVMGTDQKLVQGLKQSDFQAMCGGKPCPVVYLHEASNAGPKSIVIAIDSSGSMQPKLETVRRHLGKLIEGLGPCDQVAIFAFNNRAYLLQPLTTKHKSAENRLALLRAYGQTALYDAVEQSLRMVRKGKYHRGAIVLVTDGMDNTNGTSKNDLLADLRRSGVPVYAIGIGNPGADLQRQMAMGPFVFNDHIDEVDSATLQTITSTSGGADFIVPSMDRDDGAGFTTAVANIADLINGGYEIGVTTSPDESTPVVSVANNPDLIVHVSGGNQTSK